ncbi:MAG: HAD-IA family hydrolase [Treponema sp.]|nr:HAD-IA family hydrolase [Treponema sp.]
MTKYLLFDLDNTLYSRRYGLEDNAKIRMQEFISGFLGIESEEVWHLRRTEGKKYGTSLEWIMTEKGFTDVDAYMAAIHPEDEADNLPPDPDLRAFLEGIDIPKAILTNSPMEHARRIIDKLEFNGLFTHIFDIRQFDFKGKPHHRVYNYVLNVLGADAPQVLFIDDYPQYTESFLSLGGRALLLDENDFHKDYPRPKISQLKELIGYLCH